MAGITASTVNYLAHIYLSGDDPQTMIGGLLGDFVKGPLAGRYPTGIERGIALHRAIDAWFDQQPQIARARSRFQPPFRRFAGVIVDICYDHLLARRWAQYHPQPLDHFAGDFYRHLQRYYHQLPDNARRFADNAPRVRLLESYSQPGAVAIALERISRRLRRPVPLAQAAPQVTRDMPLLDSEFGELFPQLRNYAATKLTELGPVDTI